MICQGTILDAVRPKLVDVYAPPVETGGVVTSVPLLFLFVF